MYLLQFCQMTIQSKLIKLLIIIINVSISSNSIAQSQVLEYTSNVSVENDQLTVEKSFLIEIADQDTDWLSDVSIYYDKNNYRFRSQFFQFTCTFCTEPRGLASKIKAQRLFPSDKFMGVFSGSRQVNALRGVCGINGVKRVVCR